MTLSSQPRSTRRMIRWSHSPKNSGLAAIAVRSTTCWTGFFPPRRANDVDLIVETTGDCPLIDPAIVSKVIDFYLAGEADYVSNALVPRTYPVGMDTQIFATDILADVAGRTDAPDDREHVSLFIYKNPDLFRIAAVTAPPHHHAPETRLTLDTPDDLAVIRRVFEALYPGNPEFDLSDMLAFLDDDDAT